MRRTDGPVTDTAATTEPVGPKIGAAIGDQPRLEFGVGDGVPVTAHAAQVGFELRSVGDGPVGAALKAALRELRAPYASNTLPRAEQWNGTRMPTQLTAQQVAGVDLGDLLHPRPATRPG